MNWFLIAGLLLLAAIGCHLAASFGVLAKIGWSELGWACFTGAVFALWVGSRI